MERHTREARGGNAAGPPVSCLGGAALRGLGSSHPFGLPGLGPTFSSSRSRMRTSAGLFPGSRSTFLCRDHLHMPGPGERGRPARGAAALRGDPSDQDPMSQRPRPCLCAATGADPGRSTGSRYTWVGFSHAGSPHLLPLVDRECPAQTGGRWDTGRGACARGSRSSPPPTFLEVTWAWRTQGFHGQGELGQVVRQEAAGPQGTLPQPLGG